ncbi:sulfatase [Kiritimatiellaeota bacterium B1221]|nr:sulfatase [Kiritimatiellaeota bacterium B1221]
MNIVYFHSHDTGRAIEPYGFDVTTPTLKALAEEGALFLDAHCAAPTCSPSRAGLLTGHTPHESGMVGLAHRGGKMNTPEHHLANYLKAQGFYTVKAGLSHIGPEYEEHGYMEFKEGYHGSGEEITARACKFLEDFDGSKPFFLDAGYIETHRIGSGFNHDRDQPGDGDGDPMDMDAPVDFLGDHPDVRRDWKDYANSAERLDGFYAQILEVLDQRGFAEDTLVIVTTDHGVPFPEMKCSLTSRGTGVLLIMRLPGKIEKGIRSSALVSHLDVFPTICDLLGSPAPDWLQGKSLLPVLSGNPDAEINEAVFAEVSFHAAFEPKRSVRSREWNYIRNFASPHAPILPNCDDGLSKQLWLQTGRFDREVPAEELYDLTKDPMELVNLAEDPAYAKVKAACRARLSKWMEDTNDPFLSDDPGVLPGTMLVNTWDQLHPAGGDMQSEWDPTLWKLIQPL